MAGDCAIMPGMELTLPTHDATPPLPRRLLQALALKRGWMKWDTGLARAGEAAGPPRVLLRVDEFPHARAFDPGGRFGTDAFRRFHAVLAEAGVPYLLAITPRVSRNYLDPTGEEWRPLEDAEVETMQELAAEGGVVFALHGLDHRTRHASPRRHSELCGLSPAATEERIEAALRSFAELGLETPVFVAPFNRFDAAQYDVLARRFDVVCGGPESVRLLGFGTTPAWRGEAVYLPSYPPLYGHAAAVAGEVERLAAVEAALWAPSTLHWGWELEDGFDSLRGLCRALSGQTASWREFLAAVESSRAVT
jgi:peptidoglycan/xylan/chitin deacetylase (PgdA/CDA1 family)